jgi:hypothetical protein
LGIAVPAFPFLDAKLAEQALRTPETGSKEGGERRYARKSWRGRLRVLGQGPNGESGKLAAARIYDDTDPSLRPRQ